MFTQGPLSVTPMLIRHPILLKNTRHVMLLGATLHSTTEDEFFHD